MIRLILLAPVVVLVILFALSNREPVVLHLWPLDGAWSVPLSVGVLVLAAASFLFGALIAWMSAMPARSRARRMGEAARVLAAEVSELRARNAREVSGAVPPVRSAGTSVVPLRRDAA